MVKHAPADVRRAQLFVAAMEVCAEKGYHATKVEDIATRAGLSKGAVYHHFKSKLDLFVSLLEGSMDQFAGMIDQIASATSTLTALRQILQLALATYTPQVRAGMGEFVALALREPAVREGLHRHYYGLIGAGARLIARGVASGELRADLDPERASHAYFIGLDGVAFVYQALGEPERADQTLLDLSEHLLDSFAARRAEPGKE